MGISYVLIVCAWTAWGLAQDRMTFASKTECEAGRAAALKFVTDIDEAQTRCEPEG